MGADANREVESFVPLRRDVEADLILLVHIARVHLQYGLASGFVNSELLRAMEVLPLPFRRFLLELNHHSVGPFLVEIHVRVLNPLVVCCALH